MPDSPTRGYYNPPRPPEPKCDNCQERPRIEGKNLCNTCLYDKLLGTHVGKRAEGTVERELLRRIFSMTLRSVPTTKLEIVIETFSEVITRAEADEIVDELQGIIKMLKEMPAP